MEWRWLLGVGGGEPRIGMIPNLPEKETNNMEKRGRGRGRGREGEREGEREKEGEGESGRERRDREFQGVKSVC